jgi:esterase/lipase
MISFVGCNSKTGAISEEQQQAVENCIEYIKNSSFVQKDSINTNIVEIKTVKETWKSASVKESKAIEDAIDQTDWVITIGDTSAHDFAIIFCDSSTYKVLDYMPIK